MYAIKETTMRTGGIGHTYLETRYTAVRRVWLFWLIPIWMPVTGDWRATFNQAKHDIRQDIELSNKRTVIWAYNPGDDDADN